MHDTHACMDAYAHVCSYVWKPKVDIRNKSSPELLNMALFDSQLALMIPSLPLSLELQVGGSPFHQAFLGVLGI